MKNRLKILRKKAGLTQQQLADRIGAAVTTVRKWENGENNIRPNWYDPLAEALHCHPAEIYTEIYPTIEAPILSWVQAGEFSEELLQDTDIEAEKVITTWHRPSVFALRVKGSSMNRVAPDGSVIIVDYHDQELVDGKYYIIRNGTGASFKRYRNNPIRFEPQSTEEHDTIFPHEGLHVVGRVVQVLTEL